MSEREGLATPEGVDEGSAWATAEGAGGPVPPRPDVEQEVTAVSPGPQAAGVPDEDSGRDAHPGGDVLGEPPHGAPVSEEQAAGPADMESQESRQARAERGTGQQYETGEG